MPLSCSDLKQLVSGILTLIRHHGGFATKTKPLYRMTHAFENHLDVRQWKLSDDLLRVLTGQINFWLAGVYDGEAVVVSRSYDRCSQMKEDQVGFPRFRLQE